MKKTALLFLLLALPFTSKAQGSLWVINSPNLHGTDSILYFIPEWPAPANGYPTLFLLHGWSGSYKDWSKHFDLQAYANRYGFLIICPDGFYNSWYLNNLDPEKMQWRTFFTEELYPQAAAKFGLDPKRTFITGLSMGGHGAINLYIDHPQWFRAGGSMSGVLDLRSTGKRDFQISQIIGEWSPVNPYFYTESAVTRIELLAPTAQEHLFIVSCGYQDVFCASTRDFADRCQKIGIPYMLQLSPGGHTWSFWGYALHQHLSCFQTLVEGGNLGYTSQAATPSPAHVTRNPKSR